MSPQDLELRELTAVASGGVSVLELRGPGAMQRAAGLARAARLAPGALCFTRLYAEGERSELLDEAMLWVHDEERVELHVHGSLPLVRRLCGELNLPLKQSSMDRQERAWERCSQAASITAARIFLDQAEGALAAEWQRLSKSSVDVCRAGLRHMLRESRDLEHILEPPLVALAGPANAGKSTLFNLLLGRERAVTDPEHGTTRDVIRERVLVGEHAIDLLDTAGQRDAGNSAAARVERAGQRLGREAQARADLVLWLQPESAACESPSDLCPPGAVLVRSRGLKVTPPGSTELPSIRSLEDPEGTRQVLASILERELGLLPGAWRQGRAVLFDAVCLAEAEAALVPEIDPRRAMDSLLAR